MTSTSTEILEAPVVGEPFVCAESHKHGENGTCYVQHKCRCGDCKRGRAEYEYWRKYNPGKAGHVDATGTRRRIQALAAMGWSANVIASRVGISEETLSKWRSATLVSRGTAKKVARWYDELSMLNPPVRDRWERYSVGSTKGRARAAGWAPPLAWDEETIDDPTAVPETGWEPDRRTPERWLTRHDETLVEAALRGEKPRLSPVERRAAVTALHAYRWSARRIADWIGCNTKTVERIRESENLESFDQNDILDAA